MSNAKTVQVMAMYRDIAAFKEYLKTYIASFSAQYPTLSKESKHIFLYELIAKIVDILEEELQLPRESVFDLVLDNDEYNRYQEIKAINLETGR